MTSNQKGIAFACLTAFFWGFLAIALKVAVQKVEPQTIVWFRFVVAFSVLSVWQLVHKPQSLKILVRPPLLLIFAAIALSWNYLGFMLGIHYTSPSNAQLVIQTGPILLALAGVIFFKERLRLQQLFGFVLAIAGFLLFYSQQIKLMIGQESQYNLGYLFTLSGAAAWSIYAVLQKKLVQSHAPAVLNLFLFGFPALVYLPFVDFAPLAQLEWVWWALLIFLGLNTLIAYSSLAVALRHTEANKVSIIILLNPIITFITMGIFSELQVSWIDAERFSVYSLLGAAIVFTGAVLVVKKKRKKTESPSSE
ncbi:DMT family transporter [Gaoshiqia sediminis]|uniref:DMT family transporter n=1 Tax=Gaoshiqia sediminis TaxID=2986998 RepID=A0AA42C9U8_9BACT|nr:DMT family transporter [Gaoshiqia sediminis]MCW0482927.1 DMT family transporter [Gaoshiqia sediminis]